MIFEKINLENLLKVSRNVKVNIFLPVPSEIRESAWSELRQRVNGFVPKRALFFFFFFFDPLPANICVRMNWPVFSPIFPRFSSCPLLTHTYVHITFPSVLFVFFLFFFARANPFNVS